MSKFGLSERVMGYIINSVKSYSEIEKMSIFGSRAIGNYKTGSDIDLVCFGENMDHDTVRQLKQQYNEELPIPYFVDVVAYNEIENKELKNHINEYGIEIYNSHHHKV